jgi:hypothetical protein
MSERGPMDPTPSLDDFLAAYEADDNEWWRAACGDHQNWFEMAVDRMQAAEAEVVALRSAGSCPDCLHLWEVHSASGGCRRHGCRCTEPLAGSATSTGDDDE